MRFETCLLPVFMSHMFSVLSYTMVQTNNVYQRRSPQDLSLGRDILTLKFQSLDLKS